MEHASSEQGMASKRVEKEMFSPALQSSREAQQHACMWLLNITKLELPCSSKLCVRDGIQLAPMLETDVT